MLRPPSMTLSPLFAFVALLFAAPLFAAPLSAVPQHTTEKGASLHTLWREGNTPNFQDTNTQKDATGARFEGKIYVSGAELNYQTVRAILYVYNEKNIPPLDKSPLFFDYLESLTRTYLSPYHRNDNPLKVIPLKSNEVNAFAMPGGVFAVHDSLLLKAKNEGELMGVLTHELAHIKLLHYYRRQDNDLKKLTSPGLFDMATFLVTPFIWPVALFDRAINNHFAYSRLEEREADSVGAFILAENGYAIQDMSNFIGKFEEGNAHFSYLYTHPLTSERRSHLQTLVIRQQNEGPPPLSHKEGNFRLHLLQISLRLDKSNAAYFRQVIDANGLGGDLSEPHLNAYAKAYAQFKLGACKESLQSLSSLDKLPFYSAITSLRAEALACQKSPKAAAKYLESALSKHQDSFALRYYYFQFLSEFDKEAAYRAILSLSADYPHLRYLWDDLLRISAHLQNPFGATLARTYQALFQGKATLADDSLEQLQKLVKNNEDFHYLVPLASGYPFTTQDAIPNLQSALLRLQGKESLAIYK